MSFSNPVHPRRQPTRDACQLQGAGDDDDDDDDEEVDEPFEDGSLCYFKCKPRQRKCIIKVLSVTPLKYQTEVAGAVRYPKHSQLELISTPGQLQEQLEQKAQKARAQKERERKKKEREQEERAREERAREERAGEERAGEERARDQRDRDQLDRDQRDRDRGGGGGSGGGDFDAAVAAAVAAALAAAGVKPAQPAPADCSPVRAPRHMPETPPSIVLLKRQIRGLRRAASVEGVDALQRRADAMLLGELEDELERREAKRVRYGR